MRIEHSTTVEYKPTPKELAREIWEMDAIEQCELLNWLGYIDRPHKIMAQIQNMKDEEMIDNDGKRLCEWLNEYLNEGEV